MLADDLLDQAYHLAGVDAARPKQANLRRAISTAYYSIFHLLVADAVQRIGPKSPLSLRVRISRAFVHAEMKQVCRSIDAGSPAAVLLQLQPSGFSVKLRDVARTFSRLQDARHHADYDLAQTFTRTETIALLDAVQLAFRGWKVIRSSDEATVFLAALLFANRWAK